MDVSPISIPESKKFGEEVYDLQLNNWGNVGAGADAAGGSTIFNFPANQSIGAIAIHPSSIVDRVGLRYTLPNGQTNFTMVSAERPWVAPARAAVSLVSTGDYLGSGNVSGGRQYGGLWWYDTLLAEGVAASTPEVFGTALSTSAFVPEEILLRLVVSFGSKRINVSPKRTPYHNVVEVWPFGNGAEVIRRVFPIMGRKRVTAALRGRTDAAAFTARWTVALATFPGIQTLGTPPAPPALFEKQIDPAPPGTHTITGLAGEVESFDLDVGNLGADFLILKATRTAGAVPNDGLIASVTAFD